MQTKNVEQILGSCGRMISGSKTDYLRRFPDNLVIFNANICTDEGKVWFGDLDITMDHEKLAEVAIALNRRIYILYEHDARFKNEHAPLLSKAAATFEP